MTTALVIFATPGYSQEVGPGDSAVRQFQQAVEDYILLHRHAERIAPTGDLDALWRNIDALAVAIRLARPNAQQGELFTPALAPILRARLATALRIQGLTTADLLAEERADTEPRDWPVTLRVNDAFPWQVGTRMFPCLIDALPALPSELQYRIVGRDLVLVDVIADLIVDVLPFAVPDDSGETPPPARQPKFTASADRAIPERQLPEPRFITRGIDSSATP